MPAPLDSRKRDRFIELVALGLEPAEASRAVPIGEATGKRLMKKSEVVEAIDKARKRHTDGGAALREILDDMMSANLPDGTADSLTRARGAAFFAKPGVIAAYEAADDDEAVADALPHGFLVVAPRRPEEVEARGDAVRKCADTLRKALGGEAKATAALDELLNEYVPAYTAEE